MDTNASRPRQTDSVSGTRSAGATASAAPQFSRTPAYVALGVAVVLVLAVLLGARIVSERAGDVPVPVTPLPAPLADSAECAGLLDALPDRLIGHDRAEIAEPAPAGTAAWASSTSERVTLRCGVDLPLQYTEYSQPVEVDGVEWLRVADATPESTLATWYTVDRQPVVAVTADGQTLGRADDPVQALGESVGGLPQQAHEPNPAPLSQLAAAPADAAGICGELLPALPETLADAWLRSDEGGSDTVVWLNPGQEPIVLRCGVASPPNYAAGERLTQINDIPWFEDTALVNGSTASIWYALGRATDIAVSAPMAAASAALVELGDVIAAETPEQ